MAQYASPLMKIGVFYDGQYFFKVSNYYAYEHKRRARISIGGLHSFIRTYIAERCGADYSLCQIVDAHYFRGRLSARDANKNENKLYMERVFDEILMSENVLTHYLPLRTGVGGARYEKGVDVWLALEAYELAMLKHFDVLVLIACDGDYVPLVRKLNTLGVKVMLLSWDFEYEDATQNRETTRTSQQLLEEVTFPVAMHQLIDDRLRGQDAAINGLFLPSVARPAPEISEAAPALEQPLYESHVLGLNKGFGFLFDPEHNNVFFHRSNLVDAEFESLTAGQRVRYTQSAEGGRFSAISVWTRFDENITHNVCVIPPETPDPPEAIVELFNSPTTPLEP